MSMEKLSLRKVTLLSAAAASMVLGSCTTAETSQSPASSSTVTDQAKRDCHHTKVDVAPELEIKAIVPRNEDPWKTSYGIFVSKDLVTVTQYVDPNKNLVLAPTGDVKIFQLSDENGVSFVDKQSETVIHISPTNQVSQTPKVSFDMSFCPVGIGN